MNHAYAEEHSFIERYHRGDLLEDEEILFEEHFLGCAECQEKLVLARGFRKGLRGMAAEDATRQAVVAGGLFAWLAQRSRSGRTGLAMAALLLALAPTAWLLVENRRLASELTGREGISPPLVLLSAHRDALGAPATILEPGQLGEGPVVLAFDVSDDPRFESFRVTIEPATENERGDTVFVREGLRPNALEVLMISFPVDFFPPGDYRLHVAGMPGDDPAVELEGYPFRVVAAP